MILGKILRFSFSFFYYFECIPYSFLFNNLLSEQPILEMNSLFDYFAVIQPDYEHLFEDTTNSIPVRDSTITDIVMSELCVFNC